MNTNIRITKKETLSDNWYILNKITYETQKIDDYWETQKIDAYNRGNGAIFKLYPLCGLNRQSIIEMIDRFSRGKI